MRHLHTSTTLLLFALLAPAQSAAAAEGGLTLSQVRQLERVGFAVVPQAAPAGFHALSVTVDASRHAYRVVYAGPNGATITIAGKALHGKPAPATAPAAQPRGFLQKLFGGFKNLKVNADSNSATAGEENEEMTAVSADSPLLGPVNFQLQSRCLNGTNDPSKAQLRGAQFHVYGCNMREPDALVRAYRSLQRVNH